MGMIAVTGLVAGVPVTTTTQVDDATIAARQTAIANRRSARAAVPSIQDQITNLTNALVAQGALPLQTAQSLGIASISGTINIALAV